MVSTIAFLTNFLLASMALAAPTSEPDTHLSIPRTNSRSHLIDRAEVFASASLLDRAVSTGNAAGAIVTSETPGTFSVVIGTFTVPTVSGADGGVMVGVSIDVFSCSTSGLLQAGVVSRIVDGVASYFATMTWFPDPILPLDIVVRAGDEIKAIVHVLSPNSARVIIENRTSGKTFKKEFTSSRHGTSLGNTVPLVEFDQVTITNATAYSSDGTRYTAADAGIIEMVQNNILMASASVSGDTVTIQYG